MDSNKLLEIYFAIFLSIRLSLNVEFVHKVITIFSMSNEDIIIDTRMTSINPLYVPNQTKLMINSNINKISN